MAALSDADLIALIEARYQELGHTKGWRLLYSPRSTRDRARIATLGLNPGGGRTADTDWSQFKGLTNEEGNAYLVEHWLAGRFSPLQQQVQKLVDLTGCDWASVVSSNLVPFRSPTWNELPQPHESLEFGFMLLDWVLMSPELKLVALFGLGHSERRVVEAMGGSGVPFQMIPTGWGKIRARFYRTAGPVVVGLPHLSRYQIFGRPQANELEAAIAMIMADDGVVNPNRFNLAGQSQ